MASKLLWAAESVTELMGSELDNLAPGGLAIDATDYPNDTNKFTEASFQLYLAAFDAPPTAGDYLELHLFYKVDGTLYGDGDDGALTTPVPSGNTLVGIFPLDIVNGVQVIQLVGVALKPFKFKACIKHSGSTSSDLADASTHTLDIAPHGYESQ